jgi:hypothetical protein
MSDETTPQDSAAMSPASTGYGCAGRFILAIALASWIGTGCTQRNVTPPKQKKAVTVCSGCGTEWWSQSGKKPEPITKCPNCPMSEEEFEALKEQMRKRKEKP